MPASRHYINEKWQSAKHDIENVLDVENPDLPDMIDDATLKRVKGNVIDKLTALIHEFGGPI